MGASVRGHRFLGGGRRDPRRRVRQQGRRRGNSMKSTRERAAFGPAIVLLLLITLAPSASAQVTGGVTGTVADVQGGVLPGATVTLTSASKNTTLGTTVTNERGGF